MISAKWIPSNAAEFKEFFMKKTRFFAPVLTVLTVLTAVSCSRPAYINGTWNFDDGSKITFKESQGKYTAKGKTASSDGNFTLEAGGTLTTTGDNGIPEQYSARLTKNGFEINFYGDLISFKGKSVLRLSELKGKYKGKMPGGTVCFDFGSSGGNLTVTLENKEGKYSESYSYECEDQFLLFFTGGIYESEEPYKLEFLEKNKISVDGTVLTR